MSFTVFENPDWSSTVVCLRVHTALRIGVEVAVDVDCKGSI